MLYGDVHFAEGVLHTLAVSAGGDVRRGLTLLEVAAKWNAEIDKAIRYWSQQCGQYAIDFTDLALMQAFEDAGVEEVEWVTEKDERVCSTCGPMDGKIFPIDDTPAKPHPNCRCHLRPVM